VKFGGATVTKADVPAGPSVVHVIDTVVLPAPATAAKEEKKAMMEKKTDHHMADEKKADMKGEKADKKEAK